MLSEMREARFDTLQRAALVDAVIVAEHLAEVIESGALDLWAVHTAAADLAQLVLEQSDSVGAVGRM